MKYRKLRIAWSVAWGIVCLLMITLWVRSHAKYSRIAYPVTRNLTLAAVSLRGKVVIATSDRLNTRNLQVEVGPSELVNSDSYGAMFLLAVRRRPNSSGLRIRYWAMVAVTLVCVAAPWATTPWRHSLRTLLIATTLIAVLLGAIVYAMK